MIDLAEKPATLDPSLVKVDALASRWARGERESSPLHPLEAIRLLHDGAVLGGGRIPTPDDILKFDQCLNESPPNRWIIVLWYQTGGSVKQKAKRIGISRAQLYIEWRNTLSYIRGWLHAHGIDS